MTQKLLAVLDARAERLAIVARVGTDLRRWRFEGEAPRFTHVAFARRTGAGWTIDHLLNTDAGSEGHLYRQRPEEFFQDDPFEYRATVSVPSLALQRRIEEVLDSPIRDALWQPRYSRLAYPFATRYQNSNQWALEVVGAAQGGGGDRTAVQAFLARRGFRGSVLLTAGLPGQLLHRLVAGGTRFDDHPVRHRLRGRFELVLESSLRRHLLATDEMLAQETFCLGVPLGAPCPEAPVAGSVTGPDGDPDDA